MKISSKFSNPRSWLFLMKSYQEVGETAESQRDIKCWPMLLLHLWPQGKEMSSSQDENQTQTKTNNSNENKQQHRTIQIPFGDTVLFGWLYAPGPLLSPMLFTLFFALNHDLWFQENKKALLFPTSPSSSDNSHQKGDTFF